MPDFILGLDLGQSADFTAAAIAELLPATSGRPVLAIRYLHRWPLGTSYPAIVADVIRLVGRDPLKGAETVLALDRTGVGRPIYDLFKQAPLGCRVIGITITAGGAVTRDGAGYGVPKRDLIGAAQVALQAGRLKIAAALPEAATLRRELADYRVRISAAGHDSYDAREGQHDDTVLAVAMVCWLAEHNDQPNTWLVGDAPERGGWQRTWL